MNISYGKPFLLCNEETKVCTRYTIQRTPEAEEVGSKIAPFFISTLVFLFLAIVLFGISNWLRDPIQTKVCRILGIFSLILASISIIIVILI